MNLKPPSHPHRALADEWVARSARCLEFASKLLNAGFYPEAETMTGFACHYSREATYSLNLYSFTEVQLARRSQRSERKLSAGADTFRELIEECELLLSAPAALRLNAKSEHARRVYVYKIRELADKERRKAESAAKATKATKAPKALKALKAPKAA